MQRKLAFTVFLFFAGVFVCLLGQPCKADQASLAYLVKNTVLACSQKFDLKENTKDLSIVIINLDETKDEKNNKKFVGYNEKEKMYPASLVKLFFLFLAEQKLENGELTETEELRRALRDMIQESSNDATSYIVDLLTGTNSGPEFLNQKDFADFLAQRKTELNYKIFNAFSSDFSDINKNLNIASKTFCDGVYGREKQLIEANSSNYVTAEIVATLMHKIISRQAITQSRSDDMKALLHRQVNNIFEQETKIETERDYQACEFSGKSLEIGDEYYSKAGWTSKVRHDASYIELPNGSKYILIIFTRGLSHKPEIIPFISSMVREYFMNN